MLPNYATADVSLLPKGYPVLRDATRSSLGPGFVSFVDGIDISNRESIISVRDGQII